MSKKSVEAIIGKAAVDAEFRRKLLDNPSDVLSGFELSEEEKEALTNLDQEKLEVFSQSLDERLTKGWSNIG